MSLREPPAWSGPSSDPNDEQFGDVVEPTTLDSANEFDAVLVGEPYDGAVIGRRGAREGPAALREALARTKTHHFESGSIESVADLGDIEIPDDDDDDVGTVQETVRESTHEIHAADALPVFLGGDNSLTYPNAAPLIENSLGVISFDAHLDCREVRGEPTSGTPYRQLHEAGLDTFACVGARHFETSTAYAEYVGEQGGEIVTSEAVGNGPTEAVERALDAMAAVETIYISLDLDVLDSAAAPGVSAPTPGGVSTRELFSMLRTVATDDRVAGFEIVECAPPLDTEGRTAAAGARAIAHFLSGYNKEHHD
jgi:formimidoylglutamase